MLYKQKIIGRTNRLSAVQILLAFYFIAVIISTLILALPIAYKEGVHISFVDTLFTAVSALSVTGLSTISIAETFSPIGIIILALILQLGAVGIMSIGTFIWLVL